MTTNLELTKIFNDFHLAINRALLDNAANDLSNIAMCECLATLEHLKASVDRLLKINYTCLIADCGYIFNLPFSAVERFTYQLEDKFPCKILVELTNDKEFQLAEVLEHELTDRRLYVEIDDDILTLELNDRRDRIKVLNVLSVLLPTMKV